MGNLFGAPMGNCFYILGLKGDEAGVIAKHPSSAFFQARKAEKLIADIVRTAASPNVLAFPVRQATCRPRPSGRRGEVPSGLRRQ
jgi:hypothetical protein